MKIMVLGKGVFGRAIGSLLEENKVKFSYVDIDLPAQEVVDIVFIAVPVAFFESALTENLSFFHKKTIFVNCTKGINSETHRLPFQIAEKVLHTKNYLSLIGPSFAEEIVQKFPTLVSLGGTSKNHLKSIRDLLQTNYFRIQETADFKALELSSALKNVYAILCGYADGIGFKMNTKVKIINLALEEISLLLKVLGFSTRNLTQPGIMGDLVLTCSSEESRNYRFGFYLATLGYQEALEKAGSTVEGLETCKSISYLSEKYHTPLPLASLVSKLTSDKSTPKSFTNFLSSI